MKELTPDEAKKKYEELFKNQSNQNSNILKYLGVGARGALKGIGTIPDLLALPSNIALLLTNKEPLPSISEGLGEGFDYLTNNQFKPNTLGEKALGASLEFLSGGGGIAKSAATAGSNFAKKYLAPQITRDYRALAGAGAGLEVGKELNPDSILAQLFASVAGGATPSAIQKIINPRKTLASISGINPTKVNSFQEAALNPTLADISDSRFIKGIQNIGVETPIAGGIISKRIQATNEKIAKLGEGLSQDESGELAQKGLRNYQIKGSNIAGKLQQKMTSYINPDEKIPIIKTLEAINKKPKLESPEAIAQFNNSIVGKEYNKFSQIAEKNNGDIPYEDLVYFRQQIDDQINNFGLMGFNKEQGALKMLRTQIQNDIGNSFKQKSSAAFKAFERHNKFYTQFAHKNEDIINKLLKDKTATETFRSITNNLKVDGKNANTVLKTLKPEEKEIFSQSLIHELGMNSQNEFNAANFATNFKKLEPKAQEIVLSPLKGEIKKQFRATIDAIDYMKGTKAIANPSGTFNQSLKLGTIGGFLTNPIKTGALLFGAISSAQLMTNPKFINWLAKGAKLKTPEEINNHVWLLARIAKNSPEITVDIQRYLKNIENIEQQSDSKKAVEQQEIPELGNDLSPDQALELYKKYYSQP